VFEVLRLAYCESFILIVGEVVVFCRGTGSEIVDELREGVLNATWACGVASRHDFSSIGFKDPPQSSFVQ
jgi:hypothetical protein